MKNKTRKILDFLLQDVHFKHNYFLIGGILLFLTIVGATSYALFSYEVYSTRSIHIAFNDTEKPVCLIDGPADTSIYANGTTTYTMNCTDNYSIIDTELTSSNFTITGDITISSIEKEVIEKGIKYIITVKSGTKGGLANLQLNANVIKDGLENYNDISNVSPNLSILFICDEMPKEESNANSPEVSLASNMIPVCYNSTNNVWVKADSTNNDEKYRWYSYSGKRWANAVTVTSTNRNTYLTALPGTPIPMNDINTMLVWIPRFSATKNGEYNGATSFVCSSSDYVTKETCEENSYKWVPTNPGAFNIIFVNEETNSHDAFIFGEQNLSGFWVGKFENSSDISCSAGNSTKVGAGCNLTSIRPKVLPNATSWRGASVSTYFYDIQKMTDSGNQYGFDKSIDMTLDTHMLKNNEWGAVAYLTQSIYGRCDSSTSCTEIGINNYYYYVTGYGARAGTSTSTTSNSSYNTSLGMEASTTGNIYGIYDMSGGADEIVMSNNSEKLASSNFDTLPNEKYYNAYTTIANYTTANLQHALVETANWYFDASTNAPFSSLLPWIRRGGYYHDSKEAGLFFYFNSTGASSSSCGSRLSVAIK